MERKSFDLELEIKGDESGEFQAYFAAFGNVDRANEVIQPGAFKNLGDFIKSGWIGLNHEHARLPIAYPVSAVQDAKGLLVTGRYHSTPDAQAVRAVARERMAAGKAVKGSIGYRVTDSEKIQLDGKSVRSLKGIDLAECSFVNMPANVMAEVVHSKSLISLDEIKEFIDECKAGRVLSGANLATMRGWATTLSDHASQITALCDQHDPAMQPMFGLPKSTGPDEIAAVAIQALALCAKIGPVPIT